MKLKPTRKLLVALAMVAALSVMFGMTLNAYAPTPQPLCAMKTLIAGEFYVPHIPQLTGLNIDMIFTTPNLIGDQSGGISPYSTILTWPDGKVDLKDLAFMAKAFGSTPGAPNWNYMADVVPDLNATTGQPSINMQDLAIVAREFGNSGVYTPYSTMYPFVRIEFNNTLPYYTPNATGFLTIPTIYQYPNYATFQVYYLTTSIGALVTFWQ